MAHDPLFGNWPFDKAAAPPYCNDQLYRLATIKTQPPGHQLLFTVDKGSRGISIRKFEYVKNDRLGFNFDTAGKAEVDSSTFKESIFLPMQETANLKVQLDRLLADLKVDWKTLQDVDPHIRGD